MVRGRPRATGPVDPPDAHGQRRREPRRDLLAHGDDVLPIPGTKRRRYLEENIAAAEIELSDAELARVDEVAPIGATAGHRYDEAGMTAVQG
jgi:hypothetical protein